MRKLLVIAVSAILLLLVAPGVDEVLSVKRTCEECGGGEPICWGQEGYCNQQLCIVQANNCCTVCYAPATGAHTCELCVWA